MIRAESLIGWVSVLIVLATLLVARGLNVAACSYLVKRIFGIQMKLAHQIVVWYSGLRGAMSNRILTPAFALGLKALALMKNKEVGYLVYRISVIICFFTILVMSLFVEPLVEKLNLIGEEDEEDENSGVNENSVVHRASVILDHFLLKSPRASDLDETTTNPEKSSRESRVGSLPSVITALPKQKMEKKEKGPDLEESAYSGNFRLDLSKEFPEFAKSS